MNVNDGAAAVDDCPSLVDHAYVNTPPSGSDDPAADACTVNGATPDDGDTDTAATGG